MKDLSVLLEELKKFRDERDWMQFHGHKDLAISMLLEAGEVLEHFQWKTSEEVKQYGNDHRDEVGEEIADVLKYLVQLADNLGIEDIVDMASKKLEKDALKYPVDKAKGRHTKYTKL